MPTLPDAHAIHPTPAGLHLHPVALAEPPQGWR